MKKYYEYLFSIVVGILYGLFYIQRGQECDLYIALLEGNFCDFIAFNFGYFTSFMESMVPFFVYQMLYGVAIYQHFTTANVYYFTRQNNRKLWFLKEAWKLFKNTGSHMLLFLLGRCFIVQIGNTYSCSTKTVFIFLVVCFLQTCYLYFFTLLINICGIRWNSMVGIMVAIVLQVCALVSLYPLKTWKCYRMWELPLMVSDCIRN